MTIVTIVVVHRRNKQLLEATDLWFINTLASSTSSESPSNRQCGCRDQCNCGYVCRRCRQPDDPNISDTLGWIDYRKGLYAPALPLASDAATRAPSDGQFQYHLGMILLKTGDRSRAHQILQRALQLQLDPTDTEDARRALGERE